MIVNIENDRKTNSANNKFSFMIAIQVPKMYVTVYKLLGIYASDFFFLSVLRKRSGL
jgi:hypothetical protein